MYEFSLIKDPNYKDDYIYKFDARKPINLQLMG